MRIFSKLMVPLLSIISLAITLPLNAEVNPTDHHSHNEQAMPVLTLDQGKKWSIDEPLRQGMESINAAVKNTLGAYHNNSLSKQDADKLAKHINDQVSYLISNCKLTPQADETLHVLISELLSGADQLSKKPLSSQGLPVIVEALHLYPLYFEHSEWQAIFSD